MDNRKYSLKSLDRIKGGIKTVAKMLMDKENGRISIDNDDYRNYVTLGTYHRKSLLDFVFASKENTPKRTSEYWNHFLQKFEHFSQKSNASESECN